MPDLMKPSFDRLGNIPLFGCWAFSRHDENLVLRS